MNSSEKKNNLYQNYFLKAQKYQAERNFFDALKLYKKINKKYPDEKIILNKIAQIYIQSNSINKGIEYLKKSLLIDPYQYELYQNLGVALYQIKDYSNALRYFDRLVQFNKINADVYFNRGLVNLALELNNSALSDFKSCVNLDPKNHHNLKEIVLILISTNKFEESLEFLDLLIQLQPNDPEILFLKAQTLNKISRSKEALDLFKKIEKLNFTSRNILLEQGLSYFNLNQYEEALIFFNKVLDDEPQNAIGLNNKGQTLFRLQKFGEALKCYEAALKINQNLPTTYVNKAEWQRNFGFYDEAIQSLVQAINLNKNYSEAYLHLGLIQLYKCDFKNGWKNYEYRSGMPKDNKGNILNDAFGKKFNELGNIFIAKEQGIGDQILYASLFNELYNMRNKIDIEVDKRLIPIFARSFPELNFLSRDMIKNSKTYDHQMGLASLPSFFRKDICSFENQKKFYLKSDQVNRNILRQRLLKDKDSKKVCGLSWCSSNRLIGKEKSINFIDLEKILKIPDLEFVSLQYKHPSFNWNDFLSLDKLKIQDLQDLDLFNDIDSMFSLVDACDFVITISCVTAHIAGSLGKKTYLLIPKSNGNLWYWHKDRTQSLWYPSVEIFIQSEQGNWINSINEVISRISSTID